MSKRSDLEIFKDWQTIRTEFEAMERMSCVPVGIRKVRADHIFDEERSVRWNREMVEKNNADYQAEVARLNTEKNKRRDAILEDIYRLIQEDVGHDLSRVKAQRLWAYAWEQGHANGFPDVYCHLQDMVELNAMILYVLHEQLGFGEQRLRKFFDRFSVEIDALVKYYEMDDEDAEWLCTRKLLDMGIDVEKWCDESRNI